jgi:hypothetical protein
MTDQANGAEATDDHLVELTDDYWSQEAWTAGSAHGLEHWLENPPGDDAPLVERVSALRQAIDQAQVERYQLGASPAAGRAAAFIESVDAVYDRRPKPKPSVLRSKGPGSAGRLAELVLLDPGLVDRVPEEMLGVIDRVLGSTADGARPIEQYIDATEAARAKLSEHAATILRNRGVDPERVRAAHELRQRYSTKPAYSMPVELVS